MVNMEQKQKDRPEAYPITYGVLGLLAFMGPMSGYDIKRLFDHMLAPMWGAAHSQIYHELRRMEESGWVTMQREEQENRPDRKVYSITQEGQKALASWQAKTPPGIYQLRDELLLKIMFGSFAPPEALIENVKAAILYHEQRLAAYRQNIQRIPARGEQFPEGARHNPYATTSEGDPYIERIAQFAIDLEKTYLRWLYEMFDFLEERKKQESG
jgi:PadR family transcriptional regulator, regulatory protein AphA